MIKIILVDDHELVRKGVGHILNNTNGMQVIAEVGNGTDAIKQVRALDPDIVLLDLKLPDISGLEVTEKLLRYNPDIKIIVLSAVKNDLYPFRLLEAGARGYLTKQCSPDELVSAVKTVHAGQRMISPAIAHQLAIAKIEGKSDSKFGKLSNKEMEVMSMVVRGEPVNDIANQLNLSPKTVNSYRYRIFDKLDIQNDVELTLLAIQHGMIDIDSDDRMSGDNAS